MRKFLTAVFIVVFTLMGSLSGSSAASCLEAMDEEELRHTIAELEAAVVRMETELEAVRELLANLREGLFELSKEDAAEVPAEPPPIVGALLAEYLFPGDLRDTSGHERHGEGAAIAFASDRFDQPANALYLDGQGGMVDTGIELDMSSTSPGYTFSAWIRAESGARTRRQVFSPDDGGYDWSLLQFGSEWHVFNGREAVNTRLPVKLDEWQFLAVVFDLAAGIRVYCDDEDWSSPHLALAKSRHTLRLGMNPGFREHFIGRLDEVRVFEGALTASQIQVLRNLP